MVVSIVDGNRGAIVGDGSRLDPPVVTVKEGSSWIVGLLPG